jgi:tellurite resistance protein TehA-like permease
MQPLSPMAAVIRDLHPGYFAFVMATSIISTGTFLLGPTWLSRVLLVLACAGLLILLGALCLRLVFFRSNVVTDLQAPDRVFGFFTVVAGMDVLGVRLALAGHPLLTAVLACVAAIIWLALTWRFQPVIARSSASFSDGFINPRVSRGRSFRLLAMRSRSRAVSVERSVPLGMY